MLRWWGRSLHNKTKLEGRNKESIEGLKFDVLIRDTFDFDSLRCVMILCLISMLIAQEQSHLPVSL